MRPRFSVSNMSVYRRASVVAAAAIVAASLVHGVASAAPALPRHSPTIARTETDAAQQARQTGKQVEVLDKTTETTQVLANPNGTFTLKSNLQPVRVKKNDAWTPIDTTLQRKPDGSLSAVATAQDTTFSAGGTAPLITVRSADKTLAISWPNPLPTPTIAGSTAVYPGVFPGVDLQITAQADSYSQVLVVHDATAAANPALTQIHLTATGTGLNLTVLADSNLSATDLSGTEIFHGAAPSMWDSRFNDQVGPRPTATNQGSGRVTPLTITGTQPAARAAAGTSTTELTLKPDPAALAGTGVVYPVYIDPSMSVRKQHWTRLTDNSWPPHYDDNSAIAQVGYCGGWTDCDGFWRARSYFQMDTSPLLPRNGLLASIWRADFSATQVWSADHNCGGGQPTTVYESAGFDPGTRWPGPANLQRPLDTKFSNAGGPCPAGNLIFNVVAGAQHATESSWPSLFLALAANNENERLQWKKFDNNPLLEVDFSFPPNNATGLHVSNEVRCDGTVITSDAHPTLYGTATDNNDPPLQPALWYDVRKADGSQQATGGGGVRINSGTEGRWTEPDTLSDGNWKYSIYVDNNPGSPQNLHHPANGGFSDFYPFTVDATPPRAPGIGGEENYPRGYWGAPNGAASAISVSSNDDAVGITYTFTGAGTERVPVTTDCNYNRTFGTSGGWIPSSTWSATNWIPIPTDLSVGYHTLSARAFDKAHNLSSEESYTFYVSPNYGRSGQRFEAENLPRSQPAGQNIGLGPQSDCCNVNWSGGSQLWFGGNAPDQSFTVSINAALDADYQIGVGLTGANDYGKISFRIDGQLFGYPYKQPNVSSFDNYHPTVMNGYQLLGILSLTHGPHNLTITTTGTNSLSVGNRYQVGLDYITLTPAIRYEAESSLQITPTQPAGQNVFLGADTVVTTGAAGSPAPSLSQGWQLGFAATAANQSFDMNFQTSLEADYALGIALARWNRFGKLRISIDDIPLLHTDTTPWDGYSLIGDANFLPLGGAHLAVGQHKITIKVVGKNPDSTGYYVGVDYLTMVPINNVTAANFTAAMNNNGIASDGVTAELDLNYASLSSQTLAAAGYAPGATATINGATFSIPAPRADGSDNVIAASQTIPLPANQQVKATAVGLLVTNTCGDVPSAIGSVTYTNNTISDSRFPAVKDWVTGPTEFAAVTLPYRNEKGAVVPGNKPKIFAIFAPVDPTRTLKSVTLPSYGSSLLPGSCSPSLHVLAIAPRPLASGWIGAWTATADTATTPAGGNNFANQTLRTVVRPAATGLSARIRVSNTLAPTPVTIDAASLAAQAGTGAATLGAPTSLTFGGQAQVTIPAGAEIYSDPVTFPTTTGGSGNLIVSLHLPNAVSTAPRQGTLHQPTFLATGNTTNDSTGSPFTTRTPNFWYLSGVEVTSANAQQGTVAVLGDTRSATAVPADGPTWVDALPAKLAAGGVPIPGSLINASSQDTRPLTQAINTVDRTVLNQPNLRTVIVALGRNDLQAGATSATIRQDLTTLIHSTSPTGIRNTRRADGTRVHVILTTVAPLDLDETNPIEQQRRQLNADILTNFQDYGADEAVDIATAVQDPAHANKTRPSYFDTSTSAPNAAYYDAVAQTIANEATGFPPGAQL
jgi:hypothetical protein